MSDTKERGRASYPMRIAQPTPTARGKNTVPRYTKLFAEAADILTEHPYGTKLLVAEFSTDYGARNTAKGIREGRVKVSPAPDGCQWQVEAYIEDTDDGKRVSRLYVSIWPDEPTPEPDDTADDIDDADDWDNDAA